MKRSVKMTSTTRPRRGEIWIVTFDPTLGAEITKEQPAVVVDVPEVGKLPLHIVVPVTEWNAGYAMLPWHTKLEPSSLNGLSKDSSADSFQVKSVSVKRFKSKVGEVSPEELENITAGIALCVGYDG